MMEVSEFQLAREIVLEGVRGRKAGNATREKRVSISAQSGLALGLEQSNLDITDAGIAFKHAQVYEQQGIINIRAMDIRRMSLVSKINPSLICPDPDHLILTPAPNPLAIRTPIHCKHLILVSRQILHHSSSSHIPRFDCRILTRADQQP